MSNSRDERYYPRTGKSPSVGDQPSGFFQTGQASGPYPNQYTQPRSIPTRYDYNNHALYTQWPSNQSSTQMNYGYYDAADTNRYASPNYYSTYPSSRASPAAPEHDVDSRKLPPLNTFSSAGRDERWPSSTASYSVGPVDVPSNSGIRSPHPSYPDSYPAYPSANTAPNYGYSMPMTDPSQLQGVSSSPQMIAPDNHRSTSPSYVSGPSRIPSYTPPPISPTTSVNEPTMKKKRKRADPGQLKVLNETYARTAFPTTDERQALAKLLDMSARSVQIWFQNKRQSMRQTRQSSSSGGALHQSFGISTHGDLVDDHGHSGYESTSMQMPSSYVPRSSQGSHTSPTISPSVSHRRPRSQDAVDTTKSQWSPRY
ncbi:homeobox-domain-containing protein [Gymnopus androsaceus JB14]|uniref:Homeobox-domain-containing protein n=1 Tax=Gymnopus androsaceus JB14 TaxID=1447944 RepID=A0A6A4IFX1_9AGAR|nr:homeobox-domain-containing protein [Gymnopus androsaceus JB14]